MPPHGFASTIVGSIFVAIGVGRLVVGDPIGLVALAGGLFLLADLWRKVTVTGDRLVAQGRVTRRSVDLSGLEAVGLSMSAKPWVAPRDGQAFSLRMVSDIRGEQSLPDSLGFAEQLRARALAAGATLEREPEGPTSQPPKGAAPFFSL